MALPGQAATSLHFGFPGPIASAVPRHGPWKPVVNWRNVTLFLVGVVVAGLGVFWLLQGADAVHVRPILCVTNCKPVTGGSGSWLAVGVVAVVVGSLAVVVSTRHMRRPSRQHPSRR